MLSIASRRRRTAFAAVLLAGTAIGGFGASWLRPAFAEAPAAPPAAGAITPPRTTAMPGFADLVARVRPAVVTITTTEAARAAADGASPFAPGSEQDRMFRRFFGDSQSAPAAPAHALGSGFIVDGQGHVVTNNHVVRGAQSVKVTLEDGTELAARVVGRDPRTDLAVLQIDAGHALPFLQLGDSAAARPGDWVVAVGNPYGLGGSVTAGIVSARGRDIGSGPYDDFLQIDAPINSGNSGGPLFATDGTVIGVNTAIFSPNGGSIGIGFAIPSNLVKQVIGQLETQGRVERGFLGAMTQPVTPAMAQALGLAGQQGALVAEVAPGGPAAKAGLRAGDVVSAIGATAVRGPRDLARAVAEARPGSTAALQVLRDGQKQTLNVTLAELRDTSKQPATQQGQQQRGPIGVALEPVTDAAREALNLPPDTRGAVIAAVRAASPADAAGLRAGDVIVAVAGHMITTPGEAATALRDANRAGKPIAVRILRDGQAAFVAIPMAAAAG